MKTEKKAMKLKREYRDSQEMNTCFLQKISMQFDRKQKIQITSIKSERDVTKYTVDI